MSVHADRHRWVSRSSRSAEGRGLVDIRRWLNEPVDETGGIRTGRTALKLNNNCELLETLAWERRGMTAVYVLKEIFISWMLGHASTLLLGSVISIETVLRFNFIRNERLNYLIGVGICKRFLVNSFIKHFNRRLRISVAKPSMNQLIELRQSMTYAESVHLIGFTYVIGRVLLNIVHGEHQGMNLPLFAVNIFANLYPALVQQINKRRIDCLIRPLSKRSDGD